MSEQTETAFVFDDDGRAWSLAEVASVHNLFASPPRDVPRRVRHFRDDQCIFCGMNGLPEEKVHSE